MSIVILNPPSLDFTVGSSGAYSTKSWFTLENAAIRYATFPADVEIVRAWIWSQQMADYPGGCYGDVTWSIYGELYSKLSGVPAQERCQPIGLGYLGRLLFRPGADQECMREFLYPIPYQPGDLIGMFPEIANAPYRALSLFTGLAVRSATGFTELPGIVYHDLINKSVTGGGAFSFRNLITDIPEGGSEIRLTLQSREHGLDLAHLSVGVRSGAGFDMAAAPVAVALGGSTLSLPPYETWRSPWVALNTTVGCDLLVHCCLTSGRPYKNGSNATCFVAGTSGHNTAAFSGETVEGMTHSVAMIEVR